MRANPYDVQLVSKVNFGHGRQYIETIRMDKEEHWNPKSLPFETAYNDHFETPLQAYLDVKPLLDWFSSVCDHSSNDFVYPQSGTSNAAKSDSSQSGRTSFTLYDPYYCNGRSANFLRQLGYHVVHEAKDFYLDIANNEVPQYDVLISNPPYSDTHKIQCIDYCFRCLFDSLKNNDRGKIFLLLMPSYIATKQYFRDRLEAAFLLPGDILYLIPSSSYKYDHPDGTGKDQCPFKSLWFCIIGTQRITSLMQYWESLPKRNNSPLLSTSLSDLKEFNLIAKRSRPNPKTRKKLQGETIGKSFETKTTPNEGNNKTFRTGNPESISIPLKSTSSQKRKKCATKTSRYRDPVSNVRSKKRF
jgi:hypothetical protein